MTSADPPELHPAAAVVVDASPRGGAYVSDDDAARIAAAVLRWLADHAPSDAGYVWHPRSLRAEADKIAPKDTP